MGNAQHSSKTGEWYTPPKWVDRVRGVLGGIDLDPCSNPQANSIVRARTYLNSGGESATWPLYGASAFVNPPGACPVDGGGLYAVCGNKGRCSCKLPRRFLELSARNAPFMSVIYLAYSVNQLRQLSTIDTSHIEYVAIALPADRIPYIKPSTMKPQRGTNCDSAFILLSCDLEVYERFMKTFTEAGCAVYRKEASCYERHESSARERK